MRSIGLLFLTLFPIALFAQKKALQLDDVHRWKKITATRITPDGKWVAYLLSPTTEGDNTLCLWNAKTQQTTRFERGADPAFSHDSRYLVFTIKPPLDTLKAQRRRKVKKDELPNDSLGIYNLASGKLEKIPDVRSYALPEKWAGWLAYQLEPVKPPKPEKTAPDSTATEKPKPEKKAPKAKKEDNKENGSKLVLRELGSNSGDTIFFVREYRFAKKGENLLAYSTGRDSTLTAGVYRFTCADRQLKPLFLSEKGKFAHLTLDEQGRQAAFLADTDTSEARIRPWQLCYWTDTLQQAIILADTGSTFLRGDREGWIISEHARPVFSEDGGKLYFGIAPQLPLPDTSLLPEEIVNVEVWNWNSSQLYTELENSLESDKKRSYPVVYHIDNPKFVPLGSPEVPDWRFQPQRTANRALAYTEEPYGKYRQWEGSAHRDVYAVDLITGVRQKIVEDLHCSPSLSPDAFFVLWWSYPDTAWFAWSAGPNKTRKLTSSRVSCFFDTQHDTPSDPGPYGTAGWLQGDEALLLYDRFDIWKLDPTGKTDPQRLTKGRENRTRYRYVRLDPEERSIAPDARMLLHHFNENTKDEGYAWLDLKTGAVTPWLNGAYSYTRQPLKAESADRLVFDRENYQTFPDLHYVPVPGRSKRQPAPEVRISDANPQTAEYQWGKVELVHWTALSGEPLDGLLFKPDGFDPKKQYPMLVYFYEKLSDGLHRHREPDFGRSSINFKMYASRGYLVFVPDIPYRTGYPGESAYNAVMSGISVLLDKGFVDRSRVGVQGHSWGGYQTAYLVTRTDLFACAEAGAPVSNMTSAYGGIRWGSGRSRQFQYERTQSRIGGSLWEYPMRYFENSPLFYLENVKTPLLILHNDQDGAVPWYQGIELFVGLRRLGKPTWLLNYNDEPHWPVKLQNRIDFQTRMQQFFDHYLLDAPLPSWMQRGVPPLEKGIRQGLEPAGRQ